MKLKKYEATKSLLDFFDSGDILLETYQGSEIVRDITFPPGESGFSIRNLIDTGHRVSDYFIELEPVECEESETYKELLPCPCGKTPTGFSIDDKDLKWFRATPDCCDEWQFEFKSDYLKLDNPGIQKKVYAAWNTLPRGTHE